MQHETVADALRIPYTPLTDAKENGVAEAMKQRKVRLPERLETVVSYIESRADELPSLAATPKRGADVLRDLIRRGAVDAMAELQRQPQTTEAALAE
jgi:hypothetical protein